MDEIRSLANAIINHLSDMDIKASPNNLNQSIAIHNCVTAIRNIIDAQNEKKVDKK